MDKSVKESMKILLEFNDPATGDLKVKNQNGTYRVGSQKDLKELNYEQLANIADLLGMSELYLGKK